MKTIAQLVQGVKRFIIAITKREAEAYFDRMALVPQLVRMGAAIGPR